MSVLDDVLKLASSLLTEAALGPLGQVDNDEDLYRRITQSNRDITPTLLNRASKLASYLYQRNPIARRIIDITVEYVLGEGITVSSKDAAVDALVKRFWGHPVNDWKVKGWDRFRDLRLYGEALWKVVETPGMGTVILEPIDPQYIDAVMWDNFDNPVAVVYRKYLGQSIDFPSSSAATRETLQCIRIDAAKDEISPAPFDVKSLQSPIGAQVPVPDAPIFEAPTGKCFYFAINRAGGATRGLSDLFPLMDFLDAADQFIWTMMERARIASAMVWDVSMKGADQPEIERETARIKKANVTRPGGVNVHSDTVVWQVLTPDLAAADTEAQMRAIMRVVLGGAGFPEYMFADAANTNRASASEQGDPVVRRMTAIQNHWVSIIDLLLRYQYQQARAHGENLPELSLESPAPWSINTPDLSSKDLAKLGAVIAQTVSALAEGEQQQYISTDTARKAYLGLLSLLGIEVDPQEEAELIAKQPKPDPATAMYSKMPPHVVSAAVKAANDKANETATGAGAAKTEAVDAAEVVRATGDAVTAALAAAKPAAAVTNLTVEPSKAPDVHVHEGDVHVAPAAPGKVEVIQKIDVQPATAPDVHVHEGAITVQPAAPAQVIVEAQQIPLETESIVENDRDGNPIRKVERVLKMGEA